MQTVCRNGCRTRAAPGTYRNPLLLGIPDKVPHNQIVIHIPHPTDDINFIFQPIPVFMGRVGIAFLKTVITQLPEISLIGVTLRNGKRRQMIFMECKFQIAFFGNPDGIFKGFLTIGEQLPEFLLTFQIELLCLKFHPVGLVHRLSGLNAQQHILHFGILFPEIVGIIGDHQWKSGFSGQPLNSLIDRALLFNSMILQFQIKIALSKNFSQFQRIVLCSIIIFLHQVLGNSTGQAG